MSKEIQVGDLAIALRTTNPAYKPYVGCVGLVVKRQRQCWCGRDAFQLEGTPAILAWCHHDLKRIPPLEELEGQRTEEKLREPVCN